MKYAYEDLGDDQFETLTVCICQKLFGISVQGFAKGKDGGRDAKFTGTAEIFPSKNSPWQGITVIQAKHTNAFNKHFSESDFFCRDITKKNNVIAKEIPRIKNLIAQKQLDNYLLFSNRKLTGNAETEIVNFIAENCGLNASNIKLIDVESIELYMKHFPEIESIANIDPLDSPLIFSPDELSQVVSVLGAQINSITGEFQDDLPEPRVSYETKNKYNKMTKEYAERLRKNYLSSTLQIKEFLEHPANGAILQKYESAADDFEMKIVSKRKEFKEFDHVMEYLKDVLFKRDFILRNNKRLTKTILFYMYWNCDIGKTDAET